jgi:hypothetical protein
MVRENIYFEEYMSADLHIHSVFSDGSMTPGEIVALAAQKGLQTISVTDHDTMAGTPEALESGKDAGVEIISGLELSALHNDTYLHILGYGMRWNDSFLTTGLSRLQNARDERNLKIVTALQDLGISINFEAVRKVSKIGQTGRPHIAKVLMAKGAVKSITEAFERYLKKGAPAYVPRFVYSAEEAIGMIKKAGGLAVLAHPVLIDPAMKHFPTILAELVAQGLDGVELFYPTQSSSIRNKIRQIADRYQLFYTGGSDYHGDIRPGSHLAGGKKLRVPQSLIEILKTRLATVKNNGREETI